MKSHIRINFIFIIDFIYSIGKYRVGLDCLNATIIVNCRYPCKLACNYYVMYVCRSKQGY